MFHRTGIVLAIAAFLAAAAPALAAGSDVPESKRTVLGKYLSAEEAYAELGAGRERILFVDVRTIEEMMFVGSTDAADALVPFAEVKHPPTWDEKRGSLAFVPNPAFVAQVDAALGRKGLARDDKVFVMCRSGERSARAVNQLAMAGYSNVWSVYDGFEGDLSKDGRRSVNGWRNAGLPWSYTLDKAKLTINPAPLR